MLQLLSSASLILAVVGIFYSLWHNDIQEAIQIKMPTHRADRDSPIDEIERVLKYKAYPLASISIVLFFIYLPVFVSALYTSLAVFVSGLETGQFPQYNPSKASLVLVVILMFALAFYSSRSAWKLRRKLHKANGN